MLYYNELDLLNAKNITNICLAANDWCEAMQKRSERIDRK